MFAPDSLREKLEHLSMWVEIYHVTISTRHHAGELKPSDTSNIMPGWIETQLCLYATQRPPSRIQVAGSLEVLVRGS